MTNIIIFKPPIVKYFKDRTELVKSTLVSTKVVLSIVSPRAAADPKSTGREVGRPPSQKLIRLTSLTIEPNEALYSLIFGNFHFFQFVLRIHDNAHTYVSPYALRK